MKEILRELEQLVLEMKDEKRNRYLEKIARIKQRILCPDLRLAVIGNFSCGKSTFLNAVLRRPLLTVDVLPTTAIPTYIDWNGSGTETEISLTDMEENSHTLNREGKEWFRNITKSELPDREGEQIDYLTTTGQLASVIQKVRISFPRKGGYPGFCIVDTPGVNPGEESAKGHVLQTQSVLREESDAAIVLFPCYCVYTRDFSMFLEENAKHLLEDSIFVVTKMDLAPEKEREKLIRFVEGRLKSEFGLKSPKVYGCAAAEALRDYSENPAQRSQWTGAFERMLLEIFASLSERREQLVPSRISEMMKDLLSELKAEIFAEQEKILQAKNAMAIYSYSNLAAEYERLRKEYSNTLRAPLVKTADSLEKLIRGKANVVKFKAGQSVRNLESQVGIKLYLQENFNRQIKDMARDIETLCLQAGNSLNQVYEKEYEKFAKETGELLKCYRYNAGDFYSFTGKVLDTRENTFLAKEIPVGGADDRGSGDMTVTDTLFWWGEPLFPFDLVGQLIYAVVRIWFRKNREEIAVKVEERVEECADSMIKQCRENLYLICRSYKQAGEDMLEEYQEEYATFFEEKEKDLQAYRTQVNHQIRNNEKRIGELDRLNSMIGSRKSG